jgi:uncharacterized protein YkwD
MRVRIILGLVCLLGLGACALWPVHKKTDRAAQPSWPQWFEADSRWLRDPALDEAAALLCARNTDAIINADVRQATGISAAHVEGFLERGERIEVLRQTITKQISLARDTLHPTHVGLAEGRSLDKKSCVAAVIIRKLVTLETQLPSRLEPGEIFPLGFAVSAPKAVWYLADPWGRVERHERTTQDGHVRDAIVPQSGAGYYVLEVLTVSASGEPQVAVIWPFLVGKARQPPRPEVLFPDSGHNDIALIRRAEALVQRLRNEQELRVFTVSPQLASLAQQRSAAVADARRLGHGVPTHGLLDSHIQIAHPEFVYSKLAEVQAQAGTLAAAWYALLDSPAHRFELVDGEMTHMGVGITRNQDALGRNLLSLVVLLSRSVSGRDAADLRVDVRAKLNLARARNGNQTLSVDEGLATLAASQAAAMVASERVDDVLLGEPVTRLALEGNNFEEVRVVLAQLDDPLRLGISDAVMEPAATHLGVGLAQPKAGGLWMVCVLVAR